MTPNKSRSGKTGEPSPTPSSPATINATKMRTQAYLMVYSASQKKVLIAQKQVMSYEAINSFSKKYLSPAWKNLKSDISHNVTNIIQKDGAIKTDSNFKYPVRKRFDGMLLSAGGVLALPGGTMDETDLGSSKVAAFREFKEEIETPQLKLIFEQFDNLDLTPLYNAMIPIYECEWSEYITGIYYGLNIDNLDNVFKEIFSIIIDSLNSMNVEIKAFEESISALNLKDSTENSLWKHLPELRNLQWASLEQFNPDMLEFFDSDKVFRKEQVRIFCSFIKKQLIIWPVSVIERFKEQIIQFVTVEDAQNESNYIAIQNLKNIALTINTSDALLKTIEKEAIHLTFFSSKPALPADIISTRPELTIDCTG